MDSTAISHAYPGRRSFPFWLALAVTLHALLLLWPGDYRPASQTVLNRLSVTLSKQVLLPMSPPHPATPTNTATPPETQPLEPAVPELPDVVDSTPAPTPPAPDAAKPVEPLPSAALLFESSERLKLPQDLPEPRPRLGRQRPAAAPPSWRSGLPGEYQRFDGRALPDRVEIVDRWLAADGSHNVLVETPSGELYCGRALAWDPMQPLVEPVMMFRACGKGTRTFEWPDELRRRSAPDPPESR